MKTISRTQPCWRLILILLGAALTAGSANSTQAQTEADRPVVQAEGVLSAAAPTGEDAAAENATEIEQPKPETADAPEAKPEPETADAPEAKPEIETADAAEAKPEPEAAKPEAADVAKPEAVEERPTEPAIPPPVGGVPQGPAETSEDGQELSGVTVMWILLILVSVIALPFLVAGFLAKRLRMPDYSWKIGLSLFTITAATVITILGWPPQLGPDLSGGVNLIYELDPQSEEGLEQVDMGQLISAVAQRVNPGGIKEVTIRQYGTKQVEIIIPRADDAEIDLVKRKISTAGALKFRITANTNDHEAIIALAQAQRDKGARSVVRDDQVVARWVRLNEKEFDDPARQTHLVTRQDERGRWEVLVVTDPWDVNGKYLVSATPGVDDRGRPAVNFTFNSRGATLFGRMTAANQPITATNFYRHLGIVLDDELRTAPRLNDVITQHGQISGDFSQEEVDFLISILNAGSLPAALNKQPISEDIVSATLGEDTVRQGSRAIAVAIAVVLLFMLVYYRFSGIVACFALVANLVLILAVMIMIKAAFTLPGLAGLVLTVGMAVDANVLIFERIREELGHGAAMRMAIRNGFSRATRTIVDANLTTLITAFVLYWIGTDQIRGFAVTLILGIVMSMYTAIFCSRIVFDIAERKRWIDDLKMRRLFGQTNFNFLGRRYVAGALSVAAIALGLAAVAGRGKGLLDIDFTGGTSVTVLLKEDRPMDIADVRREITDQEGLEDVAVVGVGGKDLQYKINTLNLDIVQVEERLREIFADRMQMNSLGFRDLKPIAAEAEPGDDSAGSQSSTGGQQPAAATANEAKDEGTSPLATDPYAGGTTATLEVGKIDAQGRTVGAVKHDTLVELIQDALTAANRPGILFDVENPDHAAGSEARFREWDLKIALNPAETKSVLEAVHERLAASPVFPSSSNIGGKVAGDTQAQAGYALFASLLFIVGYIWLRFQRIMFGLAAVVALVHDVLITLGVLALSGYVVTYLDPVASLLLLDPFKISLPIVAAFLTIIGYSLNDTIVVFDRIREVRGKSPELTSETINTSINQTLGRTILTSLTTLIVVVILYFFGGAGIHGFAFALVIGILVGTYSSIFVASPVLLWMSRSGGANSRRRGGAQSARAGA